MGKKDGKNTVRNLIMSGAVLSGLYTIIHFMAKKRICSEEIDEGNPYLASQDSLGEVHRTPDCVSGFYENSVKPLLDKILAFAGLAVLSPVFVLISLAVYMDDPGPVFFTQKRVGKDKHFFALHKFRSMKMSAPHDVPTHQLSDPEQYITKVGKFLRRTSLDELPQIWDIFCGKMSVIGPRPALWNQEDLVEQRDLYDANSVLPGLTGLAQIKGRDELEITDKAKLDGEYVKILRQGGFKALFFDVKCFAETIQSVWNSDGVVEGGTGEKNRICAVEEFEKISTGKHRRLGKTDICLSPLGFGCASVWGKDMISDQQAQELFEKAYELGITYFDTGHSYGNAEERIGKILRTSKTVKREKIVISTKFGTRNVNGRLVHDVSPEWIRESVDMSLGRMGISYIDCLQIHGPQISDFTEELYGVLEELKEQGIVRAVGANSFDTEVLEFICREKRLDFVMLDYNIMRRDREELIQRLYDNGIGVVAGAALAESLYSNRVFKIRGKKDVWYLARAMKNFRKQLFGGWKYRFINQVDGVSGSQIALGFVLDNPLISSAVFGTTTMRHLEENAGAVGVEMPAGVLERIRSV